MSARRPGGLAGWSMRTRRSGSKALSGLPRALRDLDGPSETVARSRLGVLIRSVGSDDAPDVVSRWLR